MRGWPSRSAFGYTHSGGKALRMCWRKVVPPVFITCTKKNGLVVSTRHSYPIARSGVRTGARPVQGAQRAQGHQCAAGPGQPSGGDG